MLDATGFAHFMLQDLDQHQIEEFVRRWYQLACPHNPGEATRLGERLLAVVADSTAVRKLAGNPMPPPILSIIGRRRELPRERRRVYEHAVDVLVEHWDPSKHLRDTRVDQGMPHLDRAKPAAKAMLEQFRERNFILSRFGVGVYGFVHRAFLEYLAAADIVKQFHARELTEKQLITDVFGRRWPDPA
ncbi:MAG: NACHT domain-containing protein [Pseudonocardiaceae bacterium]